MQSFVKMRSMWKFFVFAVICLTSVSTDFTDDEMYIRSKRQINGIPLVYPFGATYKLLIGFAAPVEDLGGIGLLFAANFQYQYLQFQNISALSQYYFIKTVARQERELDLQQRQDERLVFYKSLEGMLTSKGFNGQECVLRAVCEAAQYPVEEEGFVGEILHVLLTPDYGKTAFDNVDEDWKDSMEAYIDAAIAGRQAFSCPHVYDGCPEGQGIMELITTLRDE